MSRLFKAKYFRDTDLSNAPLCSGPSYAWRSIWSAGQGLKQWMVMDRGRPRWKLEGTGLFSTSSAYSKLKLQREQGLTAIQGECSNKREASLFWKAVWRMRLQNKTKVFVWRLYHEALPVACNIQKRGIELDVHCQVCGFKGESIKHIFLDCWWSISVWSGLGLSNKWESLRLDNMREWLWYCFKNFTADTFSLVCLGASLIWRNRNLVAHNKKGLDSNWASSFAKKQSSFLL